ncbi:MAG: YDG domain-containing protein [Bacteroidota bacterium]|nr:YDG domain-containing protein [Bacteroidota bacterium]
MITSGSGTGSFEIMADDDDNANVDNKFYAEYFGSDVTGINYANAEDVAFGKCPLTIGGSFTADNKTYDGTTDAIIATDNLVLVTVLGSDDVSLTGYAAQFASKDVGTDIEVSIIDDNEATSNLTGADASKYSLSFTGATTANADILAKSLTATITGNPTKVYDGTDVATLSSDDYTMETGVRNRNHYN